MRWASAVMLAAGSVVSAVPAVMYGSEGRPEWLALVVAGVFLAGAWKVRP